MVAVKFARTALQIVLFKGTVNRFSGDWDNGNAIAMISSSLSTLLMPIVAAVTWPSTTSCYVNDQQFNNTNDVVIESNSAQ